ncbi:MAG: hypothetical protein PHN42_04530 [Bacilli bacterium]|nr:hypothetical protein [Bacilli bacterium]
MKEDIIDELTSSKIKNMLYIFEKDNLSIKEIIGKLINEDEAFIMGLYLESILENKDELMKKISSANEIINEIKIKQFIQAVDNKEIFNYLQRTSKMDKISLLANLELKMTNNPLLNYEKYINILKMIIEKEKEKNKKK